ncbi:MAG: class I SAM-dependent methyltransferase [Candidatus Aminicenantes bacterium]|nr:class I SAM-dependent methyltransferase [Candidatus Aminicenantes bacterium]
MEEKFREILRRENAKFNLISRKSFEKTFDYLWLLSKQVLETLEPFDSIVDIGSGAGFPGLAIKILSPEKKVLLVEPRKKRYEFLTLAIKELGLTNIEVLKGDFFLFHKKFCDKKFDYLTCLGIKNKEDFVREDCNNIKKGYCFITGKNEVERILQLKKIKKYNSEVKKVSGKDNLFLVIIHRNGKNNSNSKSKRRSWKNNDRS